MMELQSIGLVLLLASSAVIAQYDCPLPWMQFQDKCYKFSLYKATLGEAGTDCSTDGASLVSVNSREEHEFIADWLSRTSSPDHMWWTSGRRRGQDEMSFFWEGDSTDVSGFQYWLENVEDLQGDIIIYYNQGIEWGWKLSSANAENQYICEISRAEVFRILDEERGFSYGILETDPAAIMVGPHFVKQPEDFIYDMDSVSDYVALECIAEANPQPIYKWWRDYDGNDEVINPNDEGNDRYTIINGKLIIHDPQDTQDNGDYYCTAENEFGIIRSNSAQLSFGYLLDFPKSTRDPVSVEAYAGVGIECNPPKHYPDILYSWYKDFVLNFVTSITKPYIFVSLNGKLYFSSVTKDDEGDYYCHVVSPRAGVTSTGGKVSMPIELRVLESIGSIREPQIASGFPVVFPSSPKKGDNVVIECFAWGTYTTGDLEYTWMRVDGNLPANAYFTDHGRNLNIPNVQINDAGRYRCTVNRPNGQSSTNVVQLPVDATPFFISPLQDQHIDIGADMTMRCTALAIPSPTYVWFRDAQRININMMDPDDSSRFFINDNELSIVGVTNDDRSMYQCAASNLYATNFTSAQLRVLAFAPSFEKNALQRTTYGTLLGNTTIICNPEAAPAPMISWQKNGRDLNAGPEEAARIRLLPNGNLHISRLTNSDAGNYTCIATNPYGTASSSGNLTVLSTTTIMQRATNPVAFLNTTAFIPCQASHNPLLDVTYVWYQNDFKIDFLLVKYLGNSYDVIKDPHFRRGTGINSGALFIDDVKFYHAGRYKCVVETSSDSISFETYLDVFGPPGMPAGVVGSEGTATTIKLSWIAAPTNGRPIISYVVEGLRDEFETEWSEVKTNVVGQDLQNTETLVTGLSPWSSYTFRIHAINSLGIGQPSDPSSQYTTLPSAPLLKPKNVGGGGGKVGDLTINWDLLPPADHNGPGLGYHVYWKRKDLLDDEWDTEDVTGHLTEGHFVAALGETEVYNQFIVKVVAFNEEGDGPTDPFDEVTIWSAEGIPVGVATNVQAHTYNSTALLVTWNPVPDTIENINGILLGYRINYWKQEGEDETMSIYRPLGGQRDEGIIIGLDIHTYYYVNVQVFNSAGNGPKSQYYLEETLRAAPQDMPTEVKVSVDGPNSVYVSFRGVSTDMTEEPLQGYIIRYWVSGTDYTESMHVDTEKKTYYHLGGLEQHVLYNLRVLGYSRGGEGRASSPIIQFILGPDCRILEQSPEARFYYTCDGCSAHISFTLLALVAALHSLVRMS